MFSYYSGDTVQSVSEDFAQRTLHIIRHPAHNFSDRLSASQKINIISRLILSISFMRYCLKIINEIPQKSKPDYIIFSKKIQNFAYCQKLMQINYAFSQINIFIPHIENRKHAKHRLFYEYP